MLQDNRLKQLKDLIENASRDELIWMNGYISALVSNNGNGQLNGHVNGQSVSSEVGSLNGQAGTNGHAVKKISLVYGTETGNSKKVATTLAAAAKKKGISVKLQGLDQYKITDLHKEEYFFVVISTQGEGEPPITAKKFYEHIHHQKLSLANLKYSVLALGDTAYPLFCKTGEDVDIQFEKFGASRIVPIQKCDVDYDEDALAWFDKVLHAMNNVAVVDDAIEAPPPVPVKKNIGKKYYSGKLTANIDLNDRGSEKQTYHIEISTDEPVEYEPGDAFAIVPGNRRDVVDKIVNLTGIDPALEIETAKMTNNVVELLTKHLNICFLLTSTIKKYAAIIKQEIPDTRMDLVDLLRIYPVKDATQFVEVVKILSPIAPRLYSIASSPSAHSEEIHLTVAKNRFYAQDEQKYGLCSEFLGDLPVGTVINFYIHRNRAFKLPAPEKDVIMIGPGTGIAPMRSFLYERDSNGSTGRNWLFFGEQHFITDFLYQTELQAFVQTGVLNKLSLAFSRDQSYKLYVQHRMTEQGKELYQWIESGAYLYISGTKDPMSNDVENILLRIIEQYGGKSAAEAKAYFEELKHSNRYQKDVY
jgi:sulfite reductase (NADPH) flavoprotein alpha-component